MVKTLNQKLLQTMQTASATNVKKSKHMPLDQKGSICILKLYRILGLKFGTPTLMHAAFLEAATKTRLTDCQAQQAKSHISPVKLRVEYTCT
jgi:hypothetical protein